MSNTLKIEFVDNSASQYDENAVEINYGNNDSSKFGKLYLGDKASAAMVQLKHRNCKFAVSCCADLHGYAKEANVKYLKIDPSDDLNDHFDEAFKFIDQALNSKQNVVVYCENGWSKSAVIIIYYLMVKNNISLGRSYTRVKTAKGTLRIPPSLIKKLMKAEKTRSATNTLGLEDGRNVVVLDNSDYERSASTESSSRGQPKKTGTNTGPLVLLGAIVFFAGLYGVLVALTRR